MTTWTLEDIGDVLVARHDANVRALYRFYDQAGVLLYVGISAAPWARWRAHRRLKPWWHDVATITLERYFKHEIRDAEKIAIRTEKPLHNLLDVHDKEDVYCTPHPVSEGFREYVRTEIASYVLQSLLLGSVPAEYGLTGTDIADQGPFRDRENHDRSLPKTRSDLQEHADRDRRDRYSCVPDTSARPGEAPPVNQSLSVPDRTRPAGGV